MTEHMSAAIVRQKNLKEQLRRALDENDEVSCWARIERNSDDGQISQDIMKLLAVNSRFYSFMSYSQRVTDHKADNWLLHEDEFYVHWIGRGHNLGGAMITGEELETDFFMYQMNGTYDSDSDHTLSDDGEEYTRADAERMFREVFLEVLSGDALERRIRERLLEWDAEHG